MAGERSGLWARLLGALSAREPGRATEEGEVWAYFPPGVPAGYRQLRVCQVPDGEDFARLSWQVCGVCRRGLVRKIQVAGRWQRRGYGSRMMMRALRDCETYTWTTTKQSEFGESFFAALAAATGIDFGPDSRACDHMRPRGAPPAGSPGGSPRSRTTAPVSPVGPTGTGWAAERRGRAGSPPARALDQHIARRAADHDAPGFLGRLLGRHPLGRGRMRRGCTAPGSAAPGRARAPARRAAPGGTARTAAAPRPCCPRRDAP